MRDNELRRIETELGISLPGDYRSIMVDYPIRRERGSSSGLLDDDVDTLIEANRHLHEPHEGKHRHEAWPDQYFYIGGDSERSFLLDVSNPKASRVYVAKHGNPDSVTIQAETLGDLVEDYVQRLRRSGVDVNADSPAPTKVYQVAGPAIGIYVAIATAGLIGLLVGWLIAITNLPG